MVDAGTAGRVGLLVSEILTNAFRHAFPGRATGLVETRVQRLSGGVVRIQGDPAPLVRFQRLFPAAERMPVASGARSVGRRRG